MDFLQRGARSIRLGLGAVLWTAAALAAGAVAPGRVELEPPKQHGGFFAFAFSPDGSLVAGGTGVATATIGARRQVWGGEVVLWDARTGKLRRTLGSHGEGVEWVAFSRDGRTLASGSRDNGALKVWDLPSGRMRHAFSVRSGLATTAGGFQTLAALSPDGGTLAAVAARPRKLGKQTLREVGSLAAWDTRTGKQIWSVPDSGVEAMTLSPDGRTLAAFTARVTWKADGPDSARGTYSQERFRLRDFRTGRETASWAPPRGLHPKIMAYRADGREIALFQHGELKWLDPASRRDRKGCAFDKKHWAYSRAALSADGRLLARCWSDYVEIVDARTGRVRGRQTFAFPEMLFHAAFAPDLGRVACTVRSPVILDLSSLR